MANAAKLASNARPGNGRGRKIPRASEPLNDGPITPEMVRDAFNVARVPVPPDAEIERLAGVFTTWKPWFVQAEADRAENERARRIAAALATLQADLPPLVARLERERQAGDPFAGWHLRSIRPLARAAARQNVAAAAAWESNVPNCVRDWRWFARVIVDELRPAMPPDTGISKGGPVSRFLAKIVPLVSGDAASAVAIAEQLQKLRK